MLKVQSVPFWNVPGYVYHDYHPPFCIFPFFTPLFAFHFAVVILATLKILGFLGKTKKHVFLLGQVWFAWNLNELPWICLG